MVRMNFALPSITSAKRMTRSRFSLLVAMTCFESSSITARSPNLFDPEYRGELVVVDKGGEAIPDELEVVAMAELYAFSAPARAWRIQVGRAGVPVGRAGVLE